MYKRGTSPTTGRPTDVATAPAKGVKPRMATRMKVAMAQPPKTKVAPAGRPVGTKK